MAYFDNAATTFPKPESVYSFMDEFYRNFGGSYGRGENKQSFSVGKVVAETRDKVKKLLQCESKQVIFTPSATIALNIIIQGVIKTGVVNIYVSPFEHNSVMRILYHYESKGKIKIHILDINEELEYEIDKIKLQFDNVKPDVIIVSHASNVVGLVAPVKTIFELAKRYDAITILDMAQTACLVDINVGSENIDYAVFAGHKTMYGPTGISGFIMQSTMDLSPVLFGGTGFDSINHNMPDDLPERFEMGTMNTVGIAGLHAALTWIASIGIDEIHKREIENRKKLLDVLKDFKYVKEIGIKEGRDYIGVVSVVFDGLGSDSAGMLLNQNGIYVRSGLQCAPLAHQTLKTSPGGTVRFSVSYFNTEEDFKQLRETLGYIEDNL